MRAIVARAVGGPEVLKLEDLPAPSAPGPGEVLVEMVVAGVNFADTERRRGVYAPPPLPWIPGREGAGRVLEVGPGADPAWLGARVSFFDPLASGTYAEFATVPTRALFRFEAELPFERMAALPAQGLTAHGVIGHAGLRAGQVVVVLAAAGGVGQLLLQLARLAGARVIGVVSTSAKRDAVTALGAEAIVGYEGFDAAVRDLTGGRGADVVLDSIGRATQATSFAALARYGLLLFYGDSSGFPEPVDVDSLYARSLRIGAFGLDLDQDADGVERARIELSRALSRGELTLQVARSFPLEAAAAAHRAIESRATTGKLVLAIRD